MDVSTDAIPGGCLIEGAASVLSAAGATTPCGHTEYLGEEVSWRGNLKCVVQQKRWC